MKDINIFEKKFDWEKVQTVMSRDLYKFLNLDKSQYSRWYKNNIEENDFFSLWEDYFLLVLNDEWNNENQIDTKDDLNNSFWRWKEAKNFLLSMDFAKDLCLSSKSKKWYEVRRYFIQVEKNYRKLLKDIIKLEQHKLWEEYIQNRLSWIIQRKTFTDIIKQELEQLFIEQSLDSWGFLYSLYTNVITNNLYDFSWVQVKYVNRKWKKKNRNKRELLSSKQLKKLEHMEEKIWGYIMKEIQNKTHCKDIYHKVKKIMINESDSFWLEKVIDNQLYLWMI